MSLINPYANPVANPSAKPGLGGLSENGGAPGKPGSVGALDAGGASPSVPGANTAAAFKDTIQNAEQAALQTGVSGADPHAMVEAFANAEVVLDAAVTIRDKVVEAYQELLRMPV
ncbi:MAG: flagellar hook-basal body complex protein FliE [Pseudomonadota bacterium]